MSGSIVISISFDKMEAARKKINKALDAAQDESDNLSNAMRSLQVDDGRLRQKAEALNAMRSRINSRMTELQRINTHIDYTVQRFKETDELCAQRIKTGGYEVRKSLGLVKKGGIFGKIASGLVSVVNKGREAWDCIKSNGSMMLDVLQTGLDIVGFVPGLGDIADGLNAVIYLARGDYASAALSAAAMIPIVGCAATAGKFAYKGMKAYKKAEKVVDLIDKGRDIYNVAKRIGKEGIEKIASKAGNMLDNARQAFGRTYEAAGVGKVRGNFSGIGKVGISKVKETPVQKNFNEVYGNRGAGVSKATKGTLKTPAQIANSSPIKIPSSANVVEQTKTGYNQIKYTWSDGTYKYEARWHTRTLGAPEGQGNTWVVTRTTPGTASGQQKVQNIMTGENQWTPMKQWQDAVSARQNGTATVEQQKLLDSGHWPAP